MKIVRHANANAFLIRAEPWLLESEAENNLILGLALQHRHDTGQAAWPMYWATIEDGTTILGCAFRTPPQQLGVSRMPLEAISLLADDVHEIYSQLPGVGGPSAEAEQFAKIWATRCAAKWVVRMRQRIHVLTAVKVPIGAPAGSMRQVADADTELIRDWLHGFVVETGIRRPAGEFADRLVRNGRIYVWEDGTPRCMVAAARESPNGASINAVYTPPVYRRRGYATAAVAALSSKLLAGGKKFCCLYTDSANPTSNAVYRRVGYEPVRDDIDIDFLDV